MVPKLYPSITVVTDYRLIDPGHALCFPEAGPLRPQGSYKVVSVLAIGISWVTLELKKMVHKPYPDADSPQLSLKVSEVTHPRSAM